MDDIHMARAWDSELHLVHYWLSSVVLIPEDKQTSIKIHKVRIALNADKPNNLLFSLKIIGRNIIYLKVIEKHIWI